MRRYETIIITDPDLSTEQREPIFKRVEDVISQENGYLALTDDWGARKLAYEIKKKQRGYYTRFDFCGTAAAVDEMERFFRIDDRVLKYMTVLLDKAADIEKIKEEIASTQKAIEEPPEKEPHSETQTPQDAAETGASTTPDTQITSANDQTQPAEKSADAEPPQTPGTQADESGTTPSDTTEEIK
jgi:small subunit ribosomal protein S6